MKHYSAAYAYIPLKQIKRNINCGKTVQQAKIHRYMHAKDATFVLHSNYDKQNTGHLNNSNYEALLGMTCIYKRQVLLSNALLSSSISQKNLFSPTHGNKIYIKSTWLTFQILTIPKYL